MALPKKKAESADEAQPIPEAPLIVETPLETVAKTLASFEEDVLTVDEATVPFPDSALGTAFSTVKKAIKDGAVPDYELRKMLDVLPNQTEGQQFDANFDLSQEITSQLQALKAIRDKIFSSDGRIKDGQTVRDAKDFMASSAQLLQVLQKSRAELINTERLQAVEEATIEAIRGLDDEVINEFLNILGEKLERIK